MAAGVGKTYRMLQEGQAEADAGRDVVIGYLEPHEREETTRAGARAGGGAAAPRSRSATSMVEEMDLPALLARAPELALIDELAHTNPPGLEHGKRYEDIADVLAAGIDVFSTVNVQHLESLERPGRRADRGAGAGDRARLGARRRRRGRPHRPHPGGADRAPAGRQDLPGREHRRGAQQLLQDREPGGAARGQPAPGGRGRRVQAARLQPGRAARDARARSGSPPTPRRRSASGCWRWSARSPAPSAWSAAPGARRSGSAPTSTCSG